jgi:PAS domain-containing protein
MGIKYKEVTEVTLRRAFKRALREMKAQKAALASESDAGFVIDRRNGRPAGETTGFQVFVRVCRYDEGLLVSMPETGGLAENLPLDYFKAAPKRKAK